MTTSSSLIRAHTAIHKGLHPVDILRTYAFLLVERTFGDYLITKPDLFPDRWLGLSGLHPSSHKTVMDAPAFPFWPNLLGVVPKVRSRT